MDANIVFLRIKRSYQSQRKRNRKHWKYAAVMLLLQYYISKYSAHQLPSWVTTVRIQYLTEVPIQCKFTEWEQCRFTYYLHRQKQSRHVKIELCKTNQRLLLETNICVEKHAQTGVKKQRTNLSKDIVISWNKLRFEQYPILSSLFQVVSVSITNALLCGFVLREPFQLFIGQQICKVKQWWNWSLYYSVC